MGTAFTPIISEAGLKSSVMTAPARSYSSIVYARLVEGCTSTLIPLCASSATCEGAMGARLSHTFMSSLLIAITRSPLPVDRYFRCKGNKLRDNIPWLFVLSAFTVHIFKSLEGNPAMNWCSISTGLTYWRVINSMAYCPQGGEIKEMIVRRKMIGHFWKPWKACAITLNIMTRTTDSNLDYGVYL